MSVLLIFLLLLSFSHGSIFSKLKKYDIISSNQLHTVTRRSAADAETEEKEVTLTLDGRKLSLELKRSRPPVSGDLDVEVVHGDGTSDTMPMLVNHFFSGIVKGVNNSKVQAYFEDDSLTALINTPEEDLMVEPIWRHTAGHDKSSMIGYKRSDIIWDHNATYSNSNSHRSFCGAVHPNRENGFDELSFAAFKPPETQKTRQRRATPNKVCRIAAIADYTFFQQTGGSSIYRTANYIIGLISRINIIYGSTNFGSGLTGVGFEIYKLRIHDTPTTTGGAHYNMMSEAAWEALTFLNLFSQDITLEEFCLAHLFTHQSFQEQVLGLAYIGSDTSTDPGGICSRKGQTEAGVTLTLNTAWSTMLDGGGSQLLAQQADLVTAHEFGHGFGSEHDPASGDCSPSTTFGDGKYLMYSFSVTGEDPNNKIFSPCSINSMKRVLQAKASTCFVAPREETPCGNGKIDAGEECDGGLLGRFDADDCCTPDCKFRSGAECSPANYECCGENCKVAPNSFTCSSDVTGGCLQPAGECYNGECQSYCEVQGLVACACTDAANACKKCCRKDNVCSVHNESLWLPDNRPCVQGYCEAGVCIKASGSLVERFFDFIDKIDFDFIVETFRTNMVGCVLGFSLLIWFPVCIVIWCKDKKKRKYREWEDTVKMRTDRTLVYDQDTRMIPAPKPERPHKPRRHRRTTAATPHSRRVTPTVETYTMSGERY
ncbi:hypothetical protein ScPMuIL_016891 [Solemya velum]